MKHKVRGQDRVAKYAALGELPKFLAAFEQAKKGSSKAEIVGLINDFDLPREAIPPQWFDGLEVWDALLHDMPLAALVRNLGKMSAVGLVRPLSQAANLVAQAEGRSSAQACLHPPVGSIDPREKRGFLGLVVVARTR